MKKRLLTAWIIACMFICLVGQTPIVALADGDDTRVISVPEGLQEVLNYDMPETQTVQTEDTTEDGEVQTGTEDENGEGQGENAVDETSEGQAANGTAQDGQGEETQTTQDDVQVGQNENAQAGQGETEVGDAQNAQDEGSVGGSSETQNDTTIANSENQTTSGDDTSVVTNDNQTVQNETIANGTSENQTVQEENAIEEILEDTETAQEITETNLTASIIASDGNTYETNVTYTSESGIPMEGVALKVTELVAEDEGYDEYLEESASKVGVDTEDILFSKVFDIKIVDENDENIEYEPTGNVDVSIRVVGVSLDEFENVNVLHFVEDKNDENVLIYDVETTVSEETVVFSTDSFSVYVIVAAPTPLVQNNLVKISDLNEFTSTNSITGKPNFEDPDGFLLSYNTGVNYFTNIVNVNNGVYGYINNIYFASRWYFEEDSNQVNTYYIYTKINGEKKYMYKIDSEAYKMNLTSNLMEATAFIISESGTTNKFFIKKADEDKYLQYSNSGKGIRLHEDHKDNAKIIITYASSLTVPNDYYGLNGKSYGLMLYGGKTTANAMMANISGTGLESKNMFVRKDPMQQSQNLFVYKDNDISFWTFESLGSDKYRVSSAGQYLKIESNSVSLVGTPDEYCIIQVVSDNNGRIKLIGVESNSEIKSNSGFKSATLGSGSWLNLAEESVYGEEDFVSRFAYKVSVSDTINVHSGTNVIIYTRIWNEEETKYEFYAIDHNGDLVPCYESGDTITWIGLQNNTLLWEITDLPNSYYQLQNTYNQKYIAPQITGDIFTTDENVLNNRINLGGRSHGDYYTTILRWDDPHYDYASIRHDNRIITSGRMAQAEQFYFAVMDPLNYNGNLTEVETVDHTQLGMTMKMVNFGGTIIKPDNASTQSPTTEQQNDVIDSRYYNANITIPNLLSTDIKANGYPEANNTHLSLAQLFDTSDAKEVNHLFIQSIYESSGYFQFDSTQNFASLGSDNNFKVYQELGTVEGQRDTRRHGQFMPYNTIDTSQPHSQNPKNLTNILAKTLDESDPRKYETLYGFNEPEDHYFGMEISGGFMQTPNGLDAWGHDLIFDFVGDDDFWLYVDDELVIDLGGMHGALAGSVNYRTGEVKVNGTNHTLYELFGKNYADRNGYDINSPEVAAYLEGIFQTKMVGGKERKVFKDYSTHTVRIFYMERGAGASNLRMRFNLATVIPGEVNLRKEVTSDNGEVKEEYISKTYPFQIFYQTDPGAEYLLWGQDQDQRDRVVNKNTSDPIDYTDVYSAGGYKYNNVFLLRPGQDVTIKFPDNLNGYFIRECGIDTSVYDTVKINGENSNQLDPAGISTTPLSGITPDTGTPNPNSYYFETTKAKVKERAEVIFSNNVIPEQLHTLTITKKLFDENGNELSRDADSTGFLVRIYLGKNSSDLKYYDTGEYHVKDPSGNYCKYVAGTGFTSIGKSVFENLTESEKVEVTFRTSPSGAADKIPAQYSIEIRNLLEDTCFKVVEEDYDIPVGYGKRSWTGTETANGHTETKLYKCYRRVDGTYENLGDENIGKITDKDAHMEVHNVRGYGINVNKVWSDSDFISQHNSIYVALFVGDNPNPIQGTVYRMKRFYSKRYFIESLRGYSFDDYKVYEVELTNAVVDENTDYVTSYDGISKKYENEILELEGNIPKHVSGSITREYTVSYDWGTPTTSAGASEPNIRTETITNSAEGGLKVLIKDTNGNALPGGKFELRDSTNNLIDTYTADSNGLITTLYLDVGNYTLTETKTPTGYQALKPTMTIEVTADSSNNKVYTVESGNSGTGYNHDTSIGTLTIINQKFTLKAIKVSSDTTSTPLAGAHFALYKQITVNGNVRKDYYPIPNFDNLVSGNNGVIQDIDENHLSPGTYYLVETEAPPGYSVLAKDVILTIDPINPSTAVIAIDDMHNDLNWLSNEVDGNGTVNYILSIPNPPDDQDIVVAPTNYSTNYKPFFMMFGFGAILVGLIVPPVLMFRRRREEGE